MRFDVLTKFLKKRGYTVVPSSGTLGQTGVFVIWRDLGNPSTHRQLDIEVHEGRITMTLVHSETVMTMAKEALITREQIAGRVHVPSFTFDIDRFDLSEDLTADFLCDQIDAMWLKDPVVSDDPVEGYIRIGDDYPKTTTMGEYLSRGLD